MPAKKSAKPTKKAAKKAAKKAPKKAPNQAPNGCTLPALCSEVTAMHEYLTKMSKWLFDPTSSVNFYADYKALREAVCNVEKQAFSGNGIDDKPPKFCCGGAAVEPNPPPTIPIFT